MMVPILPEISADCGTAIRVDTDPGDVLALLNENKVIIKGYYKVIKKDLEKRIIRLE